MGGGESKHVRRRVVVLYDFFLVKTCDFSCTSVFFFSNRTVPFSRSQVDDQMKLLQHSWSDMLVLDHIHHHMHNNLANEIMLHNGQKFNLLALGLLGVNSMSDCFTRVVGRLQELKFDVGDYICLKFLLLLNPGKTCTPANNVARLFTAAALVIYREKSIDCGETLACSVCNACNSPNLRISPQFYNQIRKRLSDIDSKPNIPNAVR